MLKLAVLKIMKIAQFLLILLAERKKGRQIEETSSFEGN